VENGVAALRRVADRAADDGITLGLEVVNRYETNIMNSVREALSYLDRLGRGNVVVHLDTTHMNMAESDFAGRSRLSRSRPPSSPRISPGCSGSGVTSGPTPATLPSMPLPFIGGQPRAVETIQQP
jgi:hypothetical protein